MERLSTWNKQQEGIDYLCGREGGDGIVEWHCVALSGSATPFPLAQAGAAAAPSGGLGDGPAPGVERGDHLHGKSALHCRSAPGPCCSTKESTLT